MVLGMWAINLLFLVIGFLAGAAAGGGYTLIFTASQIWRKTEKLLRSLEIEDVAVKGAVDRKGGGPGGGRGGKV